MERTPVTSSNIESVGYNDGECMMQIRFKTAGIYNYFMVPVYEHDDFMKAKSKGEYFKENIKGKYQYAKMREDDSIEKITCRMCQKLFPPKEGVAPEDFHCDACEKTNLSDPKMCMDYILKLDHQYSDLIKKEKDNAGELKVLKALLDKMGMKRVIEALNSEKA